MNNKPFVTLFQASHAFSSAASVYYNATAENAQEAHDDYHHFSMMLYLARERVEKVMQERGQVCAHDFELTHTGDMQCIHCGVSW